MKSRATPRRRFEELPQEARILIAAVVGTGAILTVGRFLCFPATPERVEAFLIVLSATLGSMTVKVAKRIEMSAVMVLIFTALISVGASAALDVALAGMIGTCASRRFSLHCCAFNLFSIVVATVIAALAYEVVAASKDVSLRHALAIMAGAITFFLVNTVLVALVAGLSRSIPVASLWVETFSWTFLSYLAAATLAVATAQLVTKSGPGSLALTLPIVLFVLYSYRLHVERSLAREECARLAREHEAETRSLRGALANDVLNRRHVEVEA